MQIDDLVHEVVTLAMVGLPEEKVEKILDAIASLELSVVDLGEEFVCSAALMLASSVYAIHMEEIAVLEGLESPNMFGRIQLDIGRVIDAVKNGDNPFQEEETEE